MKYPSLLIFFILLLACEKPGPEPEPSPTDYSFSIPSQGDEIATCMARNVYFNAILIKSSKGFRIEYMNENGQPGVRLTLAEIAGDYVPQGLKVMPNGQYLTYGALDGRPAWGIIQINGTWDLQSLSTEKGVLYDALYDPVQDTDGKIEFCGQIEVDSDLQNYVQRTDYQGLFLDSSSFGSIKNDGAVSLLRFEDRILMLSYTYDGPGGDRDIELREFDESLNLIRVKAWGGVGYDQPQMIVAQNRKLFICGHTTSFGDPMHDAYFARLDLDDFSLDFENAIKLDGHEGADDMKVTKDGNLAICSFAQMNPYKGGYYALIHPDGRAIYQEKFMEYERFYQLQVFDDRVVFLGQKKNDDLDVAVHIKFF